MAPRRPRPRTLLLAASLGLLVPTAVGTAPAGAVDQDLQVSAVSGAPGDTIELTSASCVSGQSGDTLRFIWARLISGTAPDEVMAAAGSSQDDGGPAVLVVPDWLDPTAPAVIEASCVEVTFNLDDVVQTETAFTPVTFDVLPGVGPSVQSRTFSRTSLLAGQAFNVAGSGCTLAGASYASVEVAKGDDPSGRTLTDFVGQPEEAEVTGTTFSTDALLANGTYTFGIQGSDTDPGSITDLSETPTDVPAGAYTAISYCGNEQGTLLLFPPEAVQVTGNAPFASVDLAPVPATSRTVTLTGGECTAGPVGAEIFLTSIADLTGSFSKGPAPASHLGPLGRRLASRTAATPGVHRSTITDLLAARHRATRALPTGGQIGTTVTPDGQGAWKLSQTADFDNGVAEGFAVCGDPLADGFLYDPQVAEIDAPPPPTTTTTAVPTTTVPYSPPANAIPGTANYAG